jgi:hypothetical protein
VTALTHKTLTASCRPKGSKSRGKKESKASPGKPAVGARGRGGKGKGAGRGGRGAARSYSAVEILERTAALRQNTDNEQLSKDRNGIKMDHYYNMFGDDRQTVVNLLTKIVNKELTCKDVFGEVGKKQKTNMMMSAHKHNLMMKAIRRNLLSLNITVSSSQGSSPDLVIGSRGQVDRITCLGAKLAATLKTQACVVTRKNRTHLVCCHINNTDRNSQVNVVASGNKRTFKDWYPVYRPSEDHFLAGDSR